MAPLSKWRSETAHREGCTPVTVVKLTRRTPTNVHYWTRADTARHDALGPGRRNALGPDPRDPPIWFYSEPGSFFCVTDPLNRHLLTLSASILLWTQR